MAPPFWYRLSDREKDALLSEQAAVIERQAARIAELEALLAQPKKTSRNSHTPPSRDEKASGSAKKDGKRRKLRPSRAGSARPLSDAPDETVKRLATACPHCADDVSGQRQRCRHCYEHIDIPPIRPHVTRIELHGGRCQAFGKRFCAAPPDGMMPGSPFGPSHSGAAPLSASQPSRRLRAAGADDEGTVRAQNLRRRHCQRLPARRDGDDGGVCGDQGKAVGRSRVIASDETTSRIDGTTRWHWVFVSVKAVLHKIAPRRAKAVAEELLGEHRPAVWVSDRDAGQQNLAPAHRVCLAHVLRDIQYAIDCGDAIFAPRLRELLRWARRIGRRRHALRATTLRHYHARAERRLDALVATPVVHPAGRDLQTAVKAWQTKFFVFLEDPDVP